MKKRREKRERDVVENVKREKMKDEVRE